MKGREKRLQIHVFYCCDAGIFIDPSFDSSLSEVSHRYCFVSPVPARRYVNTATAAKLNDLPAKTDLLSEFPPKRGSALDVIPQFLRLS